MRRLRADLNQPDLPLLLGGLGDYLLDCPRPDWEFHNYTALNAVLKDMAAEMENVGYVPAEGLAANPDNLHFNSQALYEFGLRYFDEYKKIAVRRAPDREAGAEATLSRSEMERL